MLGELTESCGCSAFFVVGAEDFDVVGLAFVVVGAALVVDWVGVGLVLFVVGDDEVLQLGSAVVLELVGSAELLLVVGVADVVLVVGVADVVLVVGVADVVLVVGVADVVLVVGVADVVLVVGVADVVLVVGVALVVEVVGDVVAEVLPPIGNEIGSDGRPAFGRLSAGLASSEIGSDGRIPPDEDVVSVGVGLVDDVVGDALAQVELVTDGVAAVDAGNPEVRVAATAAAAPPPTNATVATPAAIAIDRAWRRR